MSRGADRRSVLVPARAAANAAGGPSPLVACAIATASVLRPRSTARSPPVYSITIRVDRRGGLARKPLDQTPDTSVLTSQT